MGNLVPADGSYTEFHSWRSTDHGRSWQPIGVVQRGGSFGSSIWEPFITTDASGDLVTFFSDERDSPAHSQLLDEIVSTDGGQHWGRAIPVVRSALAADRPGMPTIARTGRAGGYVLGFEVCGRINCEVHVKSSANGRDWGAPGDLGTKVVTTDGRYLGHSPYLIWADGRLVLDAQNVYSTATNQPTEENYRAVLTNSSRGRGDWSWSPAPWTVDHSSPDCNANYSPALLPAADGQLRVTAPTSTGASGPCAERTGWNTYGGTWVTRDGTYAVTAGGDRGPKALTGSTAWTDYTISADVTVTSPTGDAGLLARVTNPSTGPDAYDGYAAFVDVGAGTLNLARADGGYEPFAGVAVPGLSAGTAYRLTFSVRGPRLVTTIAPAAGGMRTTLAFTDPYASYFHGLAGLRDHAGTASFAHVRIAN